MTSDVTQHGLATLVCLHFLGGSARSWRDVVIRLDGRVRGLSIDLPGFGDASESSGYGVQEMADSVASRLAGARLGNWMIAGHSMGAKVAAVLARRAEDGDPQLAGVRGLILAAGSPPGPEPMSDAKRESMLGWFTGDRAAWADQAHAFIADNVAAPLDPAAKDHAVADVLRMRPDAWAAWLRDGSREDWAERVGVLRTPSLILAGSEDSALGEEAQRRLTAPHYASHHLVTLKGAGHLLPIERPDEVASLIIDYMDKVLTAT